MPVGALGGLYPLELKLQASLDLAEEHWELDLSSVKGSAVFTTESPAALGVLTFESLFHPLVR